LKGITTRQPQELQPQDVAGLIETKSRIHEMRRGLGLMDEGIDVVLGALGVQVEFEQAAPPVKGLLTHRPSTNGKAAHAAALGAVRKKRTYRATKNDRPLAEYIQKYLKRNGPSTNGEITSGVLEMGYKTVTPPKKFTAAVGTCLVHHHFTKRNGQWHPNR
jgi:hypothetical protein